jgi:hypothetical protein
MNANRHRGIGRCAALIAGALILATIGAGAVERGPAPANTPPLCETGIDATDSSSLPFLHVRPVDESLAAPLRTGVRRSQTLSSLVDRLEQLNGIVYLFPGAVRRPSQDVVLRGGLSNDVKTAGAFRVLRILVQPGRGDLTIATIGHELRHAVEVLEAPDAVDLDSVARLYERIGFAVRRGIYETTAATTAERQVFDELRQCR